MDNAARIEPVAVWGQGVESDLAWSPDGRELARASGLGIDLVDVEPLAARQFVASAFPVSQVAYSPDGRYLAVAGTQVQLWDRRTLSVAATLPGVIENGLFRLRFSPGGTWLVGIGTTSGGGDPGARLIVWRTADWQIQRTWETDFCGAGADFALSPDGRQLAMLVCGQLSVENTATGDMLYRPNDQADAYLTAFSADGRELIAGIRSGKNVLRFYDLSDKASARDLEVGAPVEVAVAADGETILLRGSWDQLQQAWVTSILNRHSGKVRYTLTDVGDAILSPDGRRLAVVRLSDGGLDVRSVDSPDPVSSLKWAPVVSAIAFGRLGDASGQIVLATGDRQGRVALRDPETSVELFATNLFSDKVTAIALDASGRYLAAAHSIGDMRAEIVMFDRAAGQILHRLDVKAEREWELPIEALAFSLDGSAIAARISTFGQVRAWSVVDGAELEHPERQLWHQAQALGADAGGYLWSVDLVTSDSGTGPTRLELTRRSTALEGTLDLQVPADGVCQELQRLAISGDQRWVAIGCDKPELALWDLANDAQLWTVKAHEGVGGDGFYGNISDVSFAPYGALLASAGYDGAIRLWDAESRAPVARLAGHRDVVIEIAWSPDGRWLASISYDGTLRLWGMKP